MTELSFPTVIDNTMLTAFKSCERKFFNQHLLHLRVHEGSIHLTAGAAFAKGLEVARRSFWGEKLSPEESLLRGTYALIKEYGDFVCPSDSAKTWENMVLALHAYFERYGWERDLIQPYMTQADKPAVEFSFALPIGVNHPETGEPLIFCGRYDMLGVYHDALYVVDEKTTTRLGASWRKQWSLRAQFTGYCWGALEFGHPVVGAIVRGLSILKNDFGHEEVICPRPAHMINDWLWSTRRTIDRMIQCWKEMKMARHLSPHDLWTQNLSDSCSSYSGCPYMLLCDKANPEAWYGNYVVEPWHPLGAIE